MKKKEEIKQTKNRTGKMQKKGKINKIEIKK